METPIKLLKSVLNYVVCLWPSPNLTIQWCFWFQSELRKQKGHLISNWNRGLVGPRNHPLLGFIGVYPYSLFFLLGVGLEGLESMVLLNSNWILEKYSPYSLLTIPLPPNFLEIGVRCLGGGGEWVATLSFVCVVWPPHSPLPRHPLLYHPLRSPIPYSQNSLWNQI